MKKIGKIVGIIAFVILAVFIVRWALQEHQMSKYLDEVNTHKEYLDWGYEHGMYNDREYDIIYHFIEDYAHYKVYDKE